MLTAIRNNGLILAVFACLSTGLVALTYALTATRIQGSEEAQLMSVLNQVIPTTEHDNDLHNACTLVSQPWLTNQPPFHAYIAKKQGQPAGIAIETIAPDGYNGAIKLIVGIDNQGVITGTRVLAHHETPDWATGLIYVSPTGFSASPANRSPQRMNPAGRSEKTAVNLTSSPVRQLRRGQLSKR